MFIIAGSMISPATWSPILLQHALQRLGVVEGDARVSSVSAFG